MPARRPCFFRPGLWTLALLLASRVSLLAGGGPFNTLVVVNTNSADSVELGNYYAAAHGIPAHQICPVGIATNLASITSNQFYALLRDPITNHIAANGLGGQIDFLVLCQDFPTRILNIQGISGSLFYGPRYGGTYGCWPPISTTSNAYCRAERAFRSADGWNATNGFIAFHLIASNLPTAKLVADRGAAAQSSFPPSAIYLYNLGDGARGYREQRFANVQFAFTALPGLPAACTIAAPWSVLSGKTNVMGYHDGFGNLTGGARTNNVWMNGAYADHLTSYGGMLPVAYYDQSTVLEWMRTGATASFGTVNEPCAYLEKFPDPIMGFYYARGFSIGEAYAMAVESPYQGLFAGDPLAAPFAAPPTIAVTSQVPYQIVTGTVPVQVSAAARSNGVPAAGLDLYIDGHFRTNLAAVAPTASNLLSVVVGTRTNTALVPTNPTLFTAVAALADAVNADSNQIVSARARGDRLELIYKTYDHGGDNVSVAASVAQGTAAALTLGVGLAATNLAPSIYPARKMLELDVYSTNHAAAGDTLTCVITLTNGVAVTNVLVASQGERATNVLARLRSAIGTNAVLLATNGVAYNNFSQYPVDYGHLIARTPGPDGAGIRVDYVVTPVGTNGLVTNYNFTATYLRDNADDTRPRASILFHVRPTNGVLGATAFLDTTALADGLHVLDFIARDGSAVAAQSRYSLPLLVCNSSPQLTLLGTNGADVADGEAPAPAKGTDVGRVAWERPRTNVFSLRNNGTAALTIANWTTNGSGAAAFQISGVPAAIAAGGVSNFAVVFAPATAGVYQAALAFGSDALVPQTNLLFAGTYGLCEWSVASANGAADPPAGLYTNAHGTVLTNSVSVPAPAGGTQLVCLGWTLAGNDPTNGSATNFTMTVTNDAALVWLWTTNYWLDTEAAEHGSVDVGDAWQPAGATTQLTAAADAYYRFTNWTGSASGTNNPLDLLMDAPKAVQAHFATNYATNGVPEWWLAQYGWTNDFDAAATNDIEPDGFPTWQEYVADTLPDDDTSYPRMDFIVTGGTNPPVLTWPASTGRFYEIHRCDDLIGGDWIVHPLFLGASTWTDTNPPPATGRYYRISPSLP